MLEISELMNSILQTKPQKNGKMKVTAHMFPTLTVLCLLKPVKCGATATGETVQLILIGPSQKQSSWKKKYDSAWNY